MRKLQPRGPVLVSFLRPLLLALAAVALLAVTGCKSPQSARSIEDTKSGLFKPAASTQVIGEIQGTISSVSLGVIKITSGDALPPGTLLLARDHDLKPTSLLQTTDTVKGHIQGVTLLNGVPTLGDEVVIPGAEYTKLIQGNLDTNRQNESAAATPAAPATQSTPAAAAP
jgi:hypothetical protein